MKKVIAKACETITMTVAVVAVAIPMGIAITIYGLYLLAEWVDLHANYGGDVRARDKANWKRS